MLKIEAGILDKTRLLANVLMLVLLVGNIFFSVQYIQELKTAGNVKEDNTGAHIQEARFLKEFIEIVLNSKAAVSYDDRVMLENDIIQIHDVDLIKQWRAFVGSTDAKIAQDNAVKLMGLVANKMLD